MPVDAQGKRQVAALVELFGAEVVTTEPIVVEQRVAPPEAELRLLIPADLEYCRGHFAGAPVVPGRRAAANGPSRRRVAISRRAASSRGRRR